MAQASGDRNPLRLTVACVVESEGRFLFVEEDIDGALVLNQPAGHVEPGETPVQAALRETREETGWDVAISGLLGMSWLELEDGTCYHRIGFAAHPLARIENARLDPEIVAVHWYSVDEAHRAFARMRSPLVLSTLDRYLQGRPFPLDFFY